MELSFGEKLSLCRSKLALKQGDVAAMVGLQAAAISKYENGMTSPNVETLSLLCKAMHVSADWLLGLSSFDSSIFLTPEDVCTDPLMKRVAVLPSHIRDRLSGYLDALGE